MADDTDLLAMTIEVVSSYVGQNNMRPDDVPAFIASTHAAITALRSAPAAEREAPAKEYTPAVTVRKSLASKDHIISMIDGKPYKTLRRHLSTNGMTPEDYRSRYNLPASYPMVAEKDSAARRDMAKKIGLGRKPGQTSATTPKTKGGRGRGAATAGDEV